MIGTFGGINQEAILALQRRFQLLQQFPLLASQPLLLISRGQFDHPFWVNARQMVIKIGAMSVSNQAHVRRWADPTGDDGESPDLPTDTSGEPVGFTRYW